MARLDGWQKVRNWLIPWRVEPVSAAIGDRRTQAARPAEKQALIPTPSESTATVTESQVDSMGRFGLTTTEADLLIGSAGSEARFGELHRWVGRAHKRMELLHFPQHGGEVSIAMLRDVHPRAVADLERLLRSLVGIRSAPVDQVRSLLLQRLPGLVFPTAASKAELEDLLAVARNLNGWLAINGRLPCGCGALLSLDMF